MYGMYVCRTVACFFLLFANYLTQRGGGETYIYMLFFPLIPKRHTHTFSLPFSSPFPSPLLFLKCIYLSLPFWLLSVRSSVYVCIHIYIYLVTTCISPYLSILSFLPTYLLFVLYDCIVSICHSFVYIPPTHPPSHLSTTHTYIPTPVVDIASSRLFPTHPTHIHTYLHTPHPPISQKLIYLSRIYK